MINKKCRTIFISIIFAVILCLCGCGKDSYAYEFEIVDEISKEYTQESTQDELTEDVITQTICIHVCGAVINPGVYQLNSQSRLYEAIALAGGFTEKADQNHLNLAQLLQDGQQIYVYTTEETQMEDFMTDYLSKKQSDGLININTASMQELKNLPGIGDSKAQAIISYRENTGIFTSIEQIKKVEGIKEGLFQKIKDKITVN